MRINLQLISEEQKKDIVKHTKKFTEKECHNFIGMT